MGNPAVNSTVITTIIDTYLCPSDSSQVGPITNLTTGPTYVGQGIRSNYLLGAGTTSDADCVAEGRPNPKQQGAFYTDISALQRDFRDGMSTTVLAGESVQIKINTYFGPYWATGAQGSTHGLGLPINNLSYKFYLPNAQAPEPNPTKAPALTCSPASIPAASRCSSETARSS